MSKFQNWLKENHKREWGDDWAASEKMFGQAMQQLTDKEAAKRPTQQEWEAAIATLHKSGHAKVADYINRLGKVPEISKY